MELTKEQLEEIKKVGMFDFITNNAHKLDKADIVYLFREYSYATYNVTNENTENEIVESMIATILEDMED